MLGSLVVLELKRLESEELFAGIAVIEFLLDSATRLGMASDSTCKTTLLRPGRVGRRGGGKGLGWAGMRLSVVSPYGAASRVGSVSGMMTQPAEEKINDVRYHQRRVQIG